MSIDGNSFITGAVYPAGGRRLLQHGSDDYPTGTVPSSSPSAWLQGNTDYAPNNGLVELSLYDNSNNLLSSAPLNSIKDPNAGTNDFYFATVTGAAAGDTVVLSAGDSSYPVVGGVVFESVPEPTALCGGIACALLALTRRRRPAAAR